MPSISILLPVHNGASFLASTLASLVGQTFRDFEVIAIDDVSTDATPQIMADFAKEHAFFSYHRNTVNLKMPGSVNRAAKFATGKYLCMLNHDDELVPNYLERLHEVVERENADLIWSNLVEIDEHGVPSGKTHLDSWRGFIYREPVTRFTPGELLAEIIRRRCYPFMVTNLMRRDLFEQVGGHDVMFVPCCDAQIFMSLLFVAKKVVYVDEPLFRYRRTTTNITAKTYKTRQMPDEMEYLFVRHLRDLSRFAEHPQQFRRATYRGCGRRLLSATKHRRYPTWNYWKLLLKRAPQAI